MQLAGGGMGLLCLRGCVQGGGCLPDRGVCWGEGVSAGGVCLTGVSAGGGDVCLVGLPGGVGLRCVCLRGVGLIVYTSLTQKQTTVADGENVALFIFGIPLTCWEEGKPFHIFYTPDRFAHFFL